MKLFKTQSIKSKLILLVVVTSGLALTICCAAFVINNMFLIRSSKVSQLTAMAEVLASNSTVAVSFAESDAANELLLSLGDIETIEQACLVMSDGETLAAFNRDPDHPAVDVALARELGYTFTTDGFLDITVPIDEDGEQLGVLFIRSNMNDLNQQVRQSILISLLVLALSLMTALFVSFRLHRGISEPILKLATLARQISKEGDYSLRINHESRDEIGEFCKIFNGMLEQIQQGELQLCEARDQLEIRVDQRTSELSEANDQLKQQMVEREQMNQNMIELSHRAGKAEIATGVLHNVGNVLNSINVSAGIVDEHLRNSKVTSLEKATKLLNEQQCLAEFFMLDERGKKLPTYLTKLAEKLRSERDIACRELSALIENLDHVKTIVSMQQSYAGVSGVQEVALLPELVNDAELLNASSMTRHGIRVVRDYDDLPEVLVEKQKLLQVLVNLLKNAKDALTAGRSEGREMNIAIKKHHDLESSDSRLRIVVRDNGTGIASENLTKIFSHGFTTKKDGHGFGLHACANACNEMGGSLTVTSDGPGLGATFTIELPFKEAGATV